MKSGEIMFDKVLSAVENAIIVVSFAGVTLLAFANVIARYVFSASFSFSSEILINVAVLLTMVGASAATRQGSHPSFSILRDTSSGVRRKVVVVAVCAAMLVFYVVFAWLGLDLVSDQATSGRLTPALSIPQWMFTVAIPFGAALGGIRAVQIAVIELRGHEALTSEVADDIALAKQEAEAVESAQEAHRS